ncbi:MAG: tRNA lysidine(34) synthetase TilS [Deltaproteobacteria bacterium]|nr:tRNA lysidine(34) synthetase TilS [Deltaproteobacteria bacterium]
MHALERDILAIATRDNLLAKHERLVVGVSGGPDSTALLHVLAALRAPLDLGLVAVYVDHGLRPAETPDEGAYVRQSAAALGLDYEYVRVATAEHAAGAGLSLEHAARELRYEALRTVARQYGAAGIAVAHTADDQAEEILLRLIRGSGRKGLAGMRRRNRDLVRPFLETEKKVILAYLQDKNISYLQDSSNLDPRFLRNRVRHELLPFLERRFDPGIRRSLRKTAASLAELAALTDACWDEVITADDDNEEAATGRIVLDRQLFGRQPAALQRRLVEKILWRLGSRARYEHILRVVEAAQQGRTGSELHLSRGLRVGVRREVLEFSYPRGRIPWRGRLYAARRPD